jgi:hypothetical protein
VVRPNRLAASRRAVASDTNPFGAAPWSFQKRSSMSSGGVARMRLRSKGKGGSQSAIEASSVTPRTSGTRSRATAGPAIAAIPARRSVTVASSTTPWSVSGRKQRRRIGAPTARGCPWAARSSAAQRDSTMPSSSGTAIGLPDSSTRPPTGRSAESMPRTVE